MRLKDVLQVHTRRSENVKLRQLTDNYGAVLSEIHSRGETNVVLDISTDKIVPFLKEAERVKMLGDYNRFFITNLDTHTLNLGKLSNTSTNITSLRMVDVNSTKLETTFKQWKQQGSQFSLQPEKLPFEAALLLDGFTTFWDAFQLHATRNHKLPRLRFDCSEPRKEMKNSRGKQIVELMRMYKYPDNYGATGPLQFSNETGKRTNFEIEILELSKGSFKRIGHWNRNDKVKYDRDEGEVEQQIIESISNKNFKIVSKRSEPFFMVINTTGEEPLEGNARYKGYLVDLINELQKIMNFTYELEEIHDNEYGSLNAKTNQWNGIVKHLIEHKADLGIADMSITYERKTAVDFTAPFMNLGIGILYKKPEQKETELFSFLDPFDTTVWLCTGLSFISTSLLIFFVSRINSDDWEPVHPCNQEPEEVESIWNFMNCVWLSMGSIMGQGSDILPK
jgi:ABC-type amino acid transport substrate-binding protein